MTLSRIRAVAAGAAAAAIAAATLVAVAPGASAAGGTLTLLPSEGNGNTLLKVQTSGGCESNLATHFMVTLTGIGIKRVVASTPVTYETTNYLVGKTSLSAIGVDGVGTAPMTAPLSKILSTVKAENKDGALPNGTYTLNFLCTSAFGPAIATYTTPITILNGADGLTFTQGTGGTITNVTAPVVSGTAQVGKKLKVTSGTWSVTPDRVVYQWKLSSKVICTTAICTLPASAKNKVLTVIVTAQADGYKPGSVSVKTAKIKP